MIEDLREFLTDYEIGTILHSLYNKMEFNYDGIMPINNKMEIMEIDPPESDCKGLGTFYENLQRHRYFLNLKFRRENGTERVYFQKNVDNQGE